MRRRSHVLLLCGALGPAAVHAQGVLETPPGSSVERNLPGNRTFTQWVHDPDVLGTQATDRLESREVAAKKLETVKLKNVVPPIHYESGVAKIPDSTVAELRKVLRGLRGRKNVRLHLVGHADSQPLSPALAAIFGDNEGLSRERAGEAAEFLQRALGLPPEAIDYEWAGDTEPIASNATPEGRALNRRVEVEVWYDRLKDAVAHQQVLVKQNFKQIEVCRMQTVCRLTYVEGHDRRTRLQNVVAPLHFDADEIDVPPDFIEKIRQALKSMSDRRNVLVKFIGYTDDSPLTGRNKRIYATHVGLSKARARRVALAVQEALHLPTAAVASDGRGAARPLASNETGQGRALNRRVEVEFWYDDPLQELPNEPQMCPTPDTEIETRVYDPPWGSIPPLQIENGQLVIPDGYAGLLRRALADVSGKTHARLRFIGYTGNHPLERRTALDYGDDIGLSAARAQRAMKAIAEQLKLDPKQAEFEGRGYVQSDDVVNSGFTQGKKSYVVVQVVYDEVAQLDDYDGVNVTPIRREIKPKNAFGLNLMHITVDGQPIDDTGRSSEDIQRCTDVALDRAKIQFGFDALNANRRLAVAAQPATIVWRPGEDDGAGATVRFSMYANYSHYIQRAEVRIFGSEQSLEAKPLDVVPIGPDGFAEWQAKLGPFTAPSTALKYVLRAYGKGGTFDETVPQPLRIVYADDDHAGTAPARDAGPGAAPEPGPDAPPGPGPHAAPGTAPATAPGATPEKERPAPDDSALLASVYGRSNLGLSNIPVASGTVTVRGSAVPKDHTVWVAGRRVPVDAAGSFSAQEILPSGVHTVEVAVLDDSGNGKLYLRDLQLERKDWFYVGMADLTLSHNDTNGPMDLLQGANSTVNYDSSADGRFAFYVNGKFSDAWRLTASADTRDEPLKNLFSNFLDKSPDALFRRIDPEYHYPTFGDDGTVQETAPTLGKFYVKVAHRDNYGLWGNFKVAYMDNELAQVDRGLYGADLHYQSQATTSFGEQRFAIDGFTAEPGTIASREEFRGTGGSLYFLRRQDILTGSERVRIEIRDRVSGLVKSVKDLTPGIDYDIDYLQGRIVLAEPLSSTANDGLLVQSGGLQGDETYLVVRYEYTPGFGQLNALSTGGQVHYWIKDRVKLGLTANTNNEGDADSSLGAADVTVRVSSNSWFKLQRARTRGLIGSTAISNDGGFGFYGYDASSFTGADAGGYRADVSLGMSDFLKHADGRLTLYTQSLDGGYSAPGLATLTDTRNYGGTFRMPVTKKVSVRAKADRRVQDGGLETNAQELDVAYRLTTHWGVSTGVRKDERIDRSPVVPLTQTQGERKDAVVQMEYDSKARWSAYGFVQDTLSATGDREENGRIGTGASYRFSDRLKMNAEASNGDLGPGGKFGTQYMPTDRTTLYVNYSLESEQMGNGLLGSSAGTGGGGNVTAGMKTRLSDSTSVYVEERYRNNASSSGLTHATGFSLAPTGRLKFGASTELGTLQDALTGAETKRRAGALQVGYGFGALQLATGIEYRYDQTEQPDTSFDTRKTLLLRNNFKYQITPGSRLVGKFDRSVSASSLGQFYDGGYTEAVLGYAYRPVRNDRLNALFKYTYLYNVPASDQLTLKNTAAEFIQKSYVAAFDVTYDLTPRWSLGGKYAHRRGQMSLDRVDPAFFDNAADLYVLRVDFRFKEKWEGLIEGRMLDMPNVRDRQSGSLLVVSRYLNTHLKLGAGYNFTDFSDDLTDLSYNHKGVFVNMTGAM